MWLVNKQESRYQVIFFELFCFFPSLTCHPQALSKVKCCNIILTAVENISGGPCPVTVICGEPGELGDMNTQLLEVVIKETHSSDPQQKVIKAQQQSGETHKDTSGILRTTAGGNWISCTPTQHEGPRLYYWVFRGMVT